jgi:hypothetical protein
MIGIKNSSNTSFPLSGETKTTCYNAPPQRGDLRQKIVRDSSSAGNLRLKDSAPFLLSGEPKTKDSAPVPLSGEDGQVLIVGEHQIPAKGPGSVQISEPRQAARH